MKIEQELIKFSFIWLFVFGLLSYFTKYSYLFVIGIIMIIMSVIWPTLIKYLYQGWIKFGEIIGGINSKIIMFLLFYMMFVPTGVLLRLFGKDLLDKKIDKKSTTYWIRRTEQPGSMKNQF